MDERRVPWPTIVVAVVVVAAFAAAAAANYLRTQRYLSCMAAGHAPAECEPVENGRPQ